MNPLLQYLIKAGEAVKGQAKAGSATEKIMKMLASKAGEYPKATSALGGMAGGAALNSMSGESDEERKKRLMAEILGDTDNG